MIIIFPFSPTYMPMAEHAHAIGLALCVGAQVCLEAERIDYCNIDFINKLTNKQMQIAKQTGDECLDCVEWRTGNWGVADDVTAPLGKHRVDGGHAVGRCDHLHQVIGLHQAGSGHLVVILIHNPIRMM
jgi:hypothetical protein